MTDPEATTDLTPTQRAVALVGLGVLLLGAYWVLRPFLIPILWAAILAYVTWPLYGRLDALLPNRPLTTSFVMTAGLILLLFGPAVAIGLSLSQEVATAVEAVRGLSTEDHHRLLAWVATIPQVGSALAERLEALLTEPEALRSSLMELARYSSGAIQAMAGDALRNLIKVGIALLTLFFLYRHGTRIVEQVRRAVDYLAGGRFWRYMAPITRTVNAVVFGLILTALAQGLLAGLGYAVTGLPVPALLGAATALLALIPFGAPVVWVPAGLALLFQGDWVAGIGLLLWGMLVVSWIDNLIRPMVISASTRIPFLLVFFGVIGGAMAFGLIGLFLGPVILSVLLTVWQEWTEIHGEAEAEQT